MADYLFKGYDNEVLAEEIDSILSTKIDVNRFFSADYALAENPGMKKVIHTYTGTAPVESLARGEGNSQFVDAEYSAKEYVVHRDQAQAKWYDDDQMTDPKLIDAKVKYVAEGMINNWTAQAIAEFNKTSNHAVCTNFGLADFADAIAKYANEYESQEGLYVLASMDMVPVLRKMLGAELQYVEAYIRTGAVGVILGVPVYTSKAVPSGIMFLATRDAVTAFIKKNTFVETDRDIDKKENFLVASRYSVIALTDESKCIKMGKAQAKALTAVADVSDGTVAGEATTGAKVTAFKKDDAGAWVEIGHATAVSNAYSIAGTLPSAGDDVKVVAELNGFLPNFLVVEAQA